MFNITTYSFKKNIYHYICIEIYLTMNQIKSVIEAAWENRNLLNENNTICTIKEVINLLDKGELRVAEPIKTGWKVNEWVKKAVVLYFPIQKMQTIEVGPLEFHDKSNCIKMLLDILANEDDHLPLIPLSTRRLFCFFQHYSLPSSEQLHLILSMS